MRKPYKHNDLSEIGCVNPKCGKRLKKNVVERNPQGKPLFCWECWIMRTRNMTLRVYKKYRALRVKIRAEGGNPRAAHTATF